MVRAKKHLGQHFLKDAYTAKKIADAVLPELQEFVLEVGPGTGAMTKYLVDQKLALWLAEIDRDSVAFLQENYPTDSFTLIQQSFLDTDWESLIGGQFAVVGNFPYNISSQIVFKAIEMREHVPQIMGMFQKEVAERICAGPGSKTYGVISVLTQAYYDCEYLFTVDENVFIPPPKVKSGVIRLTRKEQGIACNQKYFKQIVKATFNTRRKTIRNGLKTLDAEIPENEFLGLRPEQLSVKDFESLTNIIFGDKS